MLIIPVEQKVNWSKPPIVTLFLIVLNTLIFFGYQSFDVNKLEDLYSGYEESGLFDNERKHYLRYLGRSGSAQYEVIKQLDEARDKSTLIQYMLHDVGFDNYLERYVFARKGFVEDEVAAWRESRIAFEEERDDLSYIKFGIIPAEVTIAGLIGSIFMHGGFDHLLGNMVFLFIFGFSLEIALGRFVFFALYMATGILANLLYVVLEFDSYVFGIGASGAISGLMGMYLGLYGFKRINFFYSLGFYFNYVKASAALVFPVWVLKELYGAFFTEDQVNYWAHAGGLLSGYILVAATRGNVLKVDEEYLEKVEEKDPFIERWVVVENAIHALNLEQARKLLENLIKDFPGEYQVYSQYFNLVKDDIASAEGRKFLVCLLSAPKNEVTKAFVAEVYTFISSSQKGKTLLNSRKWQFALANGLSDIGEFSPAERLAVDIMESGDVSPELSKLLFKLANGFGKSGDQQRKVNYCRKIIELFPDSREADLCRSVLG